MSEASGSATLLDGTATARMVRTEVAERVLALRARGKTVHLAAVLIGDNPASEAYVSMKQKACRWVGIQSSLHRLPVSARQVEAEGLIRNLNSDASVDGILIQHPLPRQLHEPAILDLVSPEKDVDGISRSSLGALMNGEPAFGSCTAAGIIELLDRYHIPIEGAEAVVIGRSIILGKPMALMLLNRSATVTVCHSRTQRLAAHTRRADILVVGIGRPEFVTGDMIREGAAVIDAGYNRVDGRAGDVGDVDFEGAAARASHITPVPGGVGPMTIAMLLRNTAQAAEARTR